MLARPAEKPHERGETVVLFCGSPDGDVGYLKEGWDFVFRKGYSYTGWPTPVPHCWADFDSLEFDITCPKGAAGTPRLYIIDGDNFMGGRKQSIRVAGRLVGEYESFQTGQWVSVPVSAADTAAGKIPLVVRNLKPGSNAVVSIVRFAESALQ